MGATSWTFLLIGSLGAVGAALAVGTLGALLRYHRTGALPGDDADGGVTTGRMVVLWVRVVLGLALAAVGGWLLVRLGLV